MRIRAMCEVGWAVKLYRRRRYCTHSQNAIAHNCMHACRTLTYTRATQMHGRTNMVQANPGFQNKLFSMFTGENVHKPSHMGGGRGIDRYGIPIPFTSLL